LHGVPLLVGGGTHVDAVLVVEAAAYGVPLDHAVAHFVDVFCIWESGLVCQCRKCSELEAGDWYACSRGELGVEEQVEII
jgi:hypothetical protein